MPARLLVVSAYGPGTARGNVTTCQRYMDAAAAAGIHAQWAWGEGAALQAALDAVKGQVDLCHAHHALRAGWPALERGWPLVVSMGGTERELAAETGTEDRLRRVLQAARAVAVPGPLSRAEVAADVDSARIHVVPRGVPVPPQAAGPGSGAFRRELGVSGDVFVVLFPSGLRPGKDPLRAIRIMDAVARVHPRSVLVVLGLPLDASTVQAVAEAARSRPWLRVPPPVPFHQMPSVYADADVVLNTSRVEGVANALLEAQAAARPVLATDIPANLQAVPAGMSFHDDEEAVSALLAHARDDARRVAEGQRAWRYVLDNWSVEREAGALRACWSAALGNESAPLHNVGRGPPPGSVR